ncbi:lipoprotein insertase outer membrane protein LolB [Echinimonas agarilytica]|uniref:Outer-membrane lipoprotein LolB n=1 Tax=Echinimonas agarilytica TaxID=1215918 RepID=A0AA41W5A6_9GAMM|nr:lipoprotein insertase outer membrane protein LolB [Echinimonas agarilytica]MCM2679186.1 lipoprotein insertase outer membrane protein LolB [Echinimonas agarilytica]
MKHCLLLALFLTLNGCALFSPELPPDSTHVNVTSELMSKYVAHRHALNKLEQWHASGKIAIITPDDRQSTRMNWAHHSTHSKLILSNMLGVTLLEAEQSGAIARIKADGQEHTGSSLATLVWQLSGFKMPISAMTQWLTGNAEPNHISNMSLDANGHLLGFNQTLEGWGDEWKVTYNAYYPESKSMPALPSTITLKHPELTIKLVIHQWR